MTEILIKDEIKPAMTEIS